MRLLPSTRVRSGQFGKEPVLFASCGTGLRTEAHRAHLHSLSLPAPSGVLPPAFSRTVKQMFEAALDVGPAPVVEDASLSLPTSRLLPLMHWPPTEAPAPATPASCCHHHHCHHDRQVQPLSTARDFLPHTHAAHSVESPEHRMFCNSAGSCSTPTSGRSRQTRLL